MPALQSLSLINVLPEIQTPKLDAISLPHLEELVIETNNTSYWYLWSTMGTQAPRIDIQCTSQPEDFPSVAPLMRTYFNTFPMPFSSATVYPTTSYSKELVLRLENPKRLPNTCTSTGDLARVSLTIPGGDPAGLAREILDMAPKNDFTHISLSGEFGSPEGEALCKSLLPMRSVKTLEICGSEAGIALAAISMPEFGDLFPKLETLHCIAIDFGTDLHYCDRWSTPNYALDQLLKQRKNHHRYLPHLSKLRIEACDVRKRTVEQWQEMLEEVVWDGSVGSYDDPCRNGLCDC